MVFKGFLAPPVEDAPLTPPQPLEFISHYSELRPTGRRYNLSMISSVVIHLGVLYLLILNPQWLFVKRVWSTIGLGKPDTGDKPYELVTYVPSSNRPMYYPYRKPVGDLYSSQENLAVSRPPKPVPRGNQLPYSRGTTKEPLITDIVKEPAKKAGAQSDKAVEQEAIARQAAASQQAGAPPRIDVTPPAQPPSPTAMLTPPKPKDPTPKEPIGTPDPKPGDKTAEDHTAIAPRDAQSRQRLADDIANQLKMADIGQKIFENEASALRSEGSGFFDTHGFELSGYSKYIVDKIKENWLIPGTVREQRGRSTVIFYIEKDGQSSGIRLVQSSGNPLLDRAAMNSILVATPFPPLPRDFTGEHVGAKLVFSYNEVRTP